MLGERLPRVPHDWLCLRRPRWLMSVVVRPGLRASPQTAEKLTPVKVRLNWLAKVVCPQRFIGALLPRKNRIASTRRLAKPKEDFMSASWSADERLQAAMAQAVR